MLRNRTPSVLETLHSVKIWLVDQANQIRSLLNRKFEHWRHPHVDNANHNKYPLICAPVSDYPIVFFVTAISLGQNL
jgi:hypothetical protein